MFLYRAADDPKTFSGAHFAQDLETALAYTDDPGFGGPSVFRYSIDVTSEKVAKALGRKQLEELAELAGYEDSVEEAQIWRDAGFDRVFHVLENRPAVQRRLSARGFLWIVYLDDFPEGAVTWKYIGSSREAPVSDVEIEVST